MGGGNVVAVFVATNCEEMRESLMATGIKDFY